MDRRYRMLDRCLKIIIYIATHEPSQIDCNELASQFGTCGRTIRRDVAFLKSGGYISDYKQILLRQAKLARTRKKGLAVRKLNEQIQTSATKSFLSDVFAEVDRQQHMRR